MSKRSGVSFEAQAARLPGTGAGARPGRVAPGIALSLLLGWAAFGQAQSYPTISGFSPTFGNPGAVVSITGAGLLGTVEVLFNTSYASFVVVSPNRLTAVVPADATSGPLEVRTTTGVATSLQSFTAAPRVTDFFPAFGAPGDVIIVEGANFISGATVVQFNALPALVAVTAPTQLQAIVPLGATTGPILVQTFVGQASSAVPFRVVGPGPLISDFSPLSGSPGDQVVINGRKFTGATAVRFNGVAALFTVTADTQLLATVPAGATTGPINVVTPIGSGFSETHFQVLGPAPVITGFLPIQGPAGTRLTLTGRNFSGATTVKVGAVAAAFQVTADTQMQVTVPAGAATGPITVGTPFGAGTSTQVFTVVPGPTVDGFDPAAAPAGSVVIVTGERFSGATAVRFGAVAAVFSVTADTQIRATVPAGATNAPISVTTPLGTATSSNLFVVLPPGPAITGLTPEAGAPGAAVTISGAFFTGATNVLFDSVSAVFETTSDTQIRAIVPTNALTGPVWVMAPGGAARSTNTFYVAPRLRSFAPAQAPPGAVVGLVGENFAGATAVTFNGINATFTVDSGAFIRATVPLMPTTGPITVAAPGGVAISTNDFVVPLSIVSFEPLAGPVGTLVQLHGTGFSDATAALFGGIGAVFTVRSPFLITANVPLGAGDGPIAVLSAAGSAVSARSFTVVASGDLAVSLASEPGPLTPGNPTTWFLMVTNRGPGVVKNIAVTNTLPPSVSLVGLDTSAGAAAAGGGQVTWAISLLPAQAGAICALLVQPRQTGPFTNLATIAGAQFDPVWADNTAAWTGEVADLFDVDLVRNGDAESPPLPAFPQATPLPGWEIGGGLTLTQYGSKLGFPTDRSPGSTNRGANLFWGGPTTAPVWAAQSVDLSERALLIDTGGAACELAGYLGGLTDQADAASFTASFFNATNGLLATLALGPVTAADRTNTTGLLLRRATRFTPVGTRRLELRLEMTPGSGPGNNAFADDLSCTLSSPRAPVLAIKRSGASILLSWPGAFTNFVAQRTTRLPATNWVSLSGSAVLVQGRWQFTTPWATAARFYRLRAP